MRSITIYCLPALLALSLITSCLGDSGQKISLGSYPGVVVKRNDSAYIYLKGNDVIYSSRNINANVDDGDCVIVDFTVDFAQSENADSGLLKGFLTVEVSRLTPVAQHPLLSSPSDTSLALAYEHRLSAIQERNAFVAGRFFLFTEHPSTDSLPLNFSLEYDPQQAPADKVYDLFLRLSYDPEDATAAQLKTQFNAFDLEPLSRQETDSLRFRIHYIQSFSKDSVQLSWASTPVLRFPLD